jgi:predicted  nucleic acid-binding Zn-ribbon protein
VPFNIYATIIEAIDGVQLSVWVADGEVFVSTATAQDKSVAVQKYLHDFWVQEYKNAIKSQLTLEQKKQKDLEKMYDSFIRDQQKSEGNIDRYNTDIQKLQGKIADEQKNIQKAKDNQATMRANADTQKGVVLQVTDMMNNIK